MTPNKRLKTSSERGNELGDGDIRLQDSIEALNQRLTGSPQLTTLALQNHRDICEPVLSSDRMFVGNSLTIHDSNIKFGSSSSIQLSLSPSPQLPSQSSAVTFHTLINNGNFNVSDIASNLFEMPIASSTESPKFFGAQTIEPDTITNTELAINISTSPNGLSSNQNIAPDFSLAANLMSETANNISIVTNNSPSQQTALKSPLTPNDITNISALDNRLVSMFNASSGMDTTSRQSTAVEAGVRLAPSQSTIAAQTSITTSTIHDNQKSTLDTILQAAFYPRAESLNASTLVPILFDPVTFVPSVAPFVNVGVPEILQETLNAPEIWVPEIMAPALNSSANVAPTVSAIASLAPPVSVPAVIVSPASNIPQIPGIPENRITAATYIHIADSLIIAELVVLLNSFKEPRYGNKQSLRNTLANKIRSLAQPELVRAFRFLESVVSQKANLQRKKDAEKQERWRAQYEAQMLDSSRAMVPQYQNFGLPNNANHSHQMNMPSLNALIIPSVFLPVPYFKKVRILHGPIAVTFDRHSQPTMLVNLILDDDTRALLTGLDKAKYQIMFYSSSSNDLSALPLLFPIGFEILVNQLAVPSGQYLPNSYKKKSALPANLTPFLSFAPNVVNRINPRYFQSNQRYTIMIQLCQLVSDEEIILNLPTISIEDVIKKRIECVKLGLEIAVDDDLVATSEDVMLHDPYILTRILVPVKSSKCKHLQCFDAKTYFTINRTNFDFECPVCHLALPFESISIDGYFTDILSKCGEHVDAVKILPDMTWGEAEPFVSQAPAVCKNNGVDKDTVNVMSSPLLHGADEIIYISSDDDDDLQPANQGQNQTFWISD